MKILCVYNANIDALYSIDPEELISRLIVTNTVDIKNKLANPPNVINSISDFFVGLILCMKNGTGAEWLIHDKFVFQYMKEQFLPQSKLRMGGNMGIMSNVLSEMGAELVVPNVLAPTKKQLSFFSKKSIFIPQCNLNQEYNFNTEEPIHFVFNFEKDDIFDFDNITFKIPRENRFIATYDLMNMSLKLNSCFESYANNHVHEMDGLLISGFHMMLEHYPDGSNYTVYLQNALQQINNWKSNHNNLSIHMEFGHFTNSRMAQNIYLKLAPVVSSIGMNEDELLMLSCIHKTDEKSIFKLDVLSILQAAKNLLIAGKLTKIIVHTREYIVSISNLHDKLSVENQIEAMGFGVMCAGIFAAHGYLPARDRLSLMSCGLKESSIGLSQLKIFSDVYNITKYGRGAGGIIDGYQICMLPALLIDKPISTVGLGDTVTASIFLRELELLHR